MFYIYSATLVAERGFQNDYGETEMILVQFSVFYNLRNRIVKVLGMNLPFSQARLNFVKIHHFVYKRV